MQKKDFSKLKQVYRIPNLLDIQLDSYKEFLQVDAPRDKRKHQGLQQVFEEVFPIESYDGEYKLEFVNYTLGSPKYNIDECKSRGMTYAAILKIKVRLRGKKEIKEQEVYIGELPLMTSVGTFVINGEERVVVSQLHRSPGISFECEIHTSGKKLYSARVIPYRGAWIEFEFDAYGILHVVIDRRRKILVTTLLRAMGLSKDEDILKEFGGVKEIKNPSKDTIKKLIGLYTATDIVEEDTDIVIIQKREKITTDGANRLCNHKVKSIKVVERPVKEIMDTLHKDHAKSKEDALLDIYRRLRPGDPPTIESATQLMNRLFFDKRRYDLGKVGRHILSRKLKIKGSLLKQVLDLNTVLAAIKELIRRKQAEILPDDIDHLGNRRVRTVGELLQNQFRIGLARMERAAKERLSIYEVENIIPYNIINSKIISAMVRDFFGRSQLSQFMDQTNPLAEMTHKRRLSALGPGGLSRERAGFEVRDVHYSHYGRICPIETPEGPNIGLIASLSTYARINEFGFIETPYRKVENGRVTDKIEYLSADVEDQYYIAQANSKIDKTGRFVEKTVFSRYKNNFLLTPGNNVQYMDVSPAQLVSIAASLIPFLEHDDANRALMGSNMQRQAVPLLYPEAPLVGTGMERKCAYDSGIVVTAAADGVVKHVQSDTVKVGQVEYKLKKFQRSNASTCINQRPVVKIGQKIKKGDVIADGPSTKDGDLALGRNIFVAFMPWRGYNFEDAILISEKVLKDDIYTSVHVEKFEIEARDTRLGPEEITRDIPNVSEESLRNLDSTGIVRIGAEVTASDILVGKVSPKSETELSPEEKLLRAIFGEKAGDVRDASLQVPPGVEGIVVDVKIFSRKTRKSKSKEEVKKELEEIDGIKKFYTKQIDSLRNEKIKKLSKMLIGQKITAGLLDEQSAKVLIASGKTIKASNIKKLAKCDLSTLRLTETNHELEGEIERAIRVFNEQIEELSYEQDREIDKIKRGDELPPGILKKVTVFIASKRRISVGDKVAGRHGNKGVIAKILPEEDMPFMPDGRPVELVLNPLGVPSRMNVGQILETHLGWAAKILGFKVISPVFDGATEKEINENMQKANLPKDGKIELRDGYTGKKFDQKVTVGYIYMMKLIHLVDDKIHARSIGPYSLVTQQPLGGKAQFGGQRLGEMEVWALEAYGAAHTLQELLTVKSDDVIGRTKVYESIVKGEHALQPGTPESFNVLLKELQSLGLDVRAEKVEKK